MEEVWLLLRIDEFNNHIYDIFAEPEKAEQFLLNRAKIKGWNIEFVYRNKSEIRYCDKNNLIDYSIKRQMVIL